MTTSLELLADLPRPLILDGGMGTGLIARGLDIGVEPTALWNLSRPEMVSAVHAGYVAAGVDAIHTNSFAANRLALARTGIVDVRGINAAAVELARAAAGTAVVIGNLGPTGAMPPPEGDADLQELEDCFAEQASVLAAGGVAFLHIETMYHPKEARAALRGCRDGAPGLPVVLSITCRAVGADYRSPLGFSAESLIAVAIEERADGIGCNCEMTPADMSGLVAAIAAHDVGSIFAQPTATPTSGAPLYPGEFADGVGILVDLGASAIGGCCGTGSADLQAVVESSRQRRCG